MALGSLSPRQLCLRGQSAVRARREGAALGVALRRHPARRAIRAGVSVALNPKAVVPTLVHDGAVVVESTVICEYLDEVFPDHPIYPKSPLDRAHVRVWTKAVDEELHPACSAITYVVSHRHTILREGGVGSFEDFVARGANEGMAARTQKWQWIQHGLEAPGAADKIRLYDAYLHKMERALGSIRMARRRAVLDGRRRDGALRQPARGAIDGAPLAERPSAARRALVRAGVARGPRSGRRSSTGFPASSRDEMRTNGERSWPAVAALLAIAT